MLSRFVLSRILEHRGEAGGRIIYMHATGLLYGHQRLQRDVAVRLSPREDWHRSLGTDFHGKIGTAKIATDH